jgi:hypothetical protein
MPDHEQEQEPEPESGLPRRGDVSGPGVWARCPRCGEVVFVSLGEEEPR